MPTSTAPPGIDPLGGEEQLRSPPRADDGLEHLAARAFGDETKRDEGHPQAHALGHVHHVAMEEQRPADADADAAPAASSGLSNATSSSMNPRYRWPLSVVARPAARPNDDRDRRPRRNRRRRPSRRPPPRADLRAPREARAPARPTGGRRTHSSSAPVQVRRSTPPRRPLLQHRIGHGSSSAAGHDSGAPQPRSELPCPRRRAGGVSREHDDGRDTTRSPKK